MRNPWSRGASPCTTRRTGHTDRCRQQPRASRTLALAVTAVLLAALTACNQEAPTDDSSPGVCGTSADEYCYHLGNIANFYCTVREVRNELDVGRLTTADLPDWAITASVPDGSPRIYDFRRSDPERESYAERHGQLDASIEDAGRPGLDREPIRDCVDSITQEQVHDSEGGWASSPPGGSSTD